MKQGKVAALLDNDARLALEDDDPYCLLVKPHGHGDVHALMHSSGTARAWQKEGVRWVYFFQDTNGLAIMSLAAMLGVSLDLDLEVRAVSPIHHSLLLLLFFVSVLVLVLVLVLVTYVLYI
jgi:UDP-sugar pyrophosphorylase